MDNKIIFRNFRKGDYKIVGDWWKWWWKGEYIEREFLPSDDSCFMIEKCLPNLIKLLKKKLPVAAD